MSKTLSNPSIQVDNVTIPIIPNTLSYKSGKGEKKVRPQSSGGNSVDMVVTEDAETKKSMVKFQLYNAQARIENVEDWQDKDENGTSISFSEGSFNRAFRKMILVNDPEVSLSADGNLEVEFEGAPLI